MLICDLLIAWGLARCAYALRAGPVGIALILFTMIATTLGSYINLEHACQATLICHALADHAIGRRPRALALLTICLFVKPVMAYLYGFLLVLLIVRRDGFLGLVRSAVAAAVTAALLLLGFAAWFGLEPMVHTLIPIRGTASYESLNYGFFFGLGRKFWLPDRVMPRYYVFSPVGHYLVGTIILLAAAVVPSWRLARGLAATYGVDTEVVACCGIMHLTFLTSFYGAFMSWTYYYYILIIGLMAVATSGRYRAIMVALVAAAALPGYKDWGGNIKHRWRDMTPSADTFGLWADSTDRDEWRQVKQIIGDKPVSFLTTNGGCIEMFVPQFLVSEDMFLTPGWPTAAELRRKLHQIASAEFVLISKREAQRSFLDLWPEFRGALNRFELVQSGQRFLVYRRTQPLVLRRLPVWMDILRVRVIDLGHRPRP